MTGCDSGPTCSVSGAFCTGGQAMHRFVLPPWWRYVTDIDDSLRTISRAAALSLASVFRVWCHCDAASKPLHSSISWRRMLILQARTTIKHSTERDDWAWEMGQEPITKWPEGCCELLVPDPFSKRWQSPASAEPAASQQENGR